jgi:hypothetical protein
MKTILDSFRPALLGTIVLFAQAQAQEAVPSAPELAKKLSAAMQDGNSSVRVKMEIRTSTAESKGLLQLQIKARRTSAGSEVVYQVLWPKERKGESILLRRMGDRAPSGALFLPPDSLSSISASQLKEAVFGGDLAYADLVENFFAWEHQAITGTETVDQVPCQVLESKPGKGDHSIYSRVRSWIDLKRLVPLRVEKYAESGQLVRRIDTTRVAEDDTDRQVAATLLVRRPGQEVMTEMEGTRSRHDVTFPDSDFTPEGLRMLSNTASKPK